MTELSRLLPFYFPPPCHGFTWHRSSPLISCTGSDPPVISRECRCISYYLLRVVDFRHFTANVSLRRRTVEGLYDAMMEERLIYVRLDVLRSLMRTSEQPRC